MKLTPEERETIVTYDESSDQASVYTHDPKLIAKLKLLHDGFPDQIYPDRQEHPGAVSYVVPKSCVSIRKPYSPQRRLEQSQQYKAAGIKPPAFRGKK